MSEIAEKDGLALPIESVDEPRDNSLLLDEVHVMEDRIDITSLEIEDLQDACAALAGEINSLRGRLERSSAFENAKDVRNEMSARLAIDTANTPGPEGELSGVKPDETQASPGSGEDAAAAGESREAGADQTQEPEKEKEGFGKKHRKRKEPGVLDFQPEIAAAQDSSRWEATTGENVLDPFAPSEEEDKRKPKPERKRRRKKKNSAEENSTDSPADADRKNDTPEAAVQNEAAGEAVTDPDSSDTGTSGTDSPVTEPGTSGSDSPVMDTGAQEAAEQGASEPEAPAKEKKGFRFWKRKKKPDGSSDKVYCPECGAYVGEESICGKCGAKVK